ncbi:uncharacterized protein B4U80_14948 [Leptotrombidium deliense]|uniref:DUF659 domain-containing protein n=1 Tax=Leptotrombidium deliense TaxID=299467 RepID=A0A443RXP4_9ACAR|nr:uncharacterized protein B4U80_14948 [Leptotrombidium deliense]
MKPQSKVWNYWTSLSPKGQKGTQLMKCLFCSNQQQNNAVKCKKHTLKCVAVPMEVKKSLLQSTGTVAQASTSSQGSSDDVSMLTVLVPTSEPRTSNESENMSSQNSDLEKITEYIKFLDKLGVSNVAPSRKEIAGSLLESVYGSIRRENMVTLDSSENIALVIDGWKNPVFYKTIELGGRRQTAAVVTDILTEIITELGSEKIVAVVSDNASEMILTHSNVSNKFKHVVGVRCAAHTINLLTHDICKIESIGGLLHKSKSIVNEFKKSKVKMGLFKETWKTVVEEERNKGNSIRPSSLASYSAEI